MELFRRAAGVLLVETFPMVACLVVAGKLVYFNDLRSDAGGSLTTGRASLAGKVRSEKSD